MTLDAETAAWSGVQGDVWRQVWGTTDDAGEYDEASLLVQLRNRSTGALMATNETPLPDDTVAIDTSDTDFTDSANLTFVWQIDDTADIPVSTGYVIEAECEIDGRATTFFSHSWECRKQWAS